MKNIYSAIWMGSIYGSINNKDPKLRKDWKLRVWFSVSGMNAMNFITILFTLQYYFNFNYSVANYFGIGNISNALAGFVDYGLPFLILSYFCFFYKDRYKKLLPKYKCNKKLGVTYVLVSVILFALMLVLMANR